MKRLVSFDTESGETIIAEVDEVGAMVPAGLASDTVAKASKTFDDVLNQIKPIASGVIRAIDDLSAHPDEVTVEFSIKLSAKLGTAILASADGEANYKIAMTWKRSKSS